jgi:pSer/pThr/pTyr-binding forkhead associated (FHA) protein
MSGIVVLILRLLLAAGLYAFLLLTLVTLWREVKGQGALLSAHKVPPIALSIEKNGQAPQTRHFNQSELVIGRHPSCECQVDEDLISSRHARLSYHHGQWWLEDMASTNGTQLNGHRLDTPAVVISGDDFCCGETHFIVALSGDILLSPTRRLPDDGTH